MNRFEYRITRHPADDFSTLAYFCTGQGECRLDRMPTDQIEALGHILNAQGLEGWDLVQLHFGKDGVVAFWKRPL